MIFAYFAKIQKGEIDAAAYEAGIKKYIDHCVKFQEDIGLDVLVHGEPERNDMVEYFGEQISGYAFSQKWLGAKLRQPLRQATTSFW